MFELLKQALIAYKPLSIGAVMQMRLDGPQAPRMRGPPPRFKALREGPSRFRDCTRSWLICRHGR